jgi:hypothetical protein
MFLCSEAQLHQVDATDLSECLWAMGKILEGLQEVDNKVSMVHFIA